jgi:hypothetical protein
MDPWKELLDYWRAKHQDGRPPSRCDIDPVIEIPQLVANLLLADIVPGGYRYRLVGSAVVERHREEMTGKMAGTSKFLERVSAELIANYDAVRSEQKPRIMVSGAAIADRAGAVTVILPLVKKAGETEMILVGVFYDRRFEPVEHIDYLTPTKPVE